MQGREALRGTKTPSRAQRHEAANSESLPELSSPRGLQKFTTVGHIEDSRTNLTAIALAETSKTLHRRKSSVPQD